MYILIHIKQEVFVFKYKAYISTGIDGAPPIWVEVSANDDSQARELINRIYYPVKSWYIGPQRTDI